MKSNDITSCHCKMTTKLFLYVQTDKYSGLSLNEHLGETDTYSWSQPFSVTPFS